MKVDAEYDEVGSNSNLRDKLEREVHVMHLSSLALLYSDNGIHK
jgi:hypothetical protein